MDINNKRNQKILYWTPRILAIFLTSYFVLFTIVIFWNQYPLVEPERTKLLSLILTIILMINLLISWKWENVGGIIYLALCFIFYFYPFAFFWYESFSNPFFVYLPIYLGIISTLFIFHYSKLNKESLTIGDKTRKRNQKILYWTPRISALILTVFFIFYTISISWMNYSPIELKLAIFTSVILTVFLIINLLISWKWEKLGGVIYFGISYLFYQHVGIFTYMIIAYYFPTQFGDFNSQITLPYFYCSIPVGLIGFFLLFSNSELEKKKTLVFIFCPFCGVKMPKIGKSESSCIVCNKDLAFLN